MSRTGLPRRGHLQYGYSRSEASGSSHVRELSNLEKTVETDNHGGDCDGDSKFGFKPIFNP